MYIRTTKTIERSFILVVSNKERIIEALDPVKASHFIGFNALYISFVS